MDEHERTEQDEREVESHRQTFTTQDEPAQPEDEESEVEAHIARRPPTNY